MWLFSLIGRCFGVAEAQSACSSQISRGSFYSEKMSASIKEPSTGKEFSTELDTHVLTGCGVRTKTVFFITVNVYALGLYLCKDGLQAEFSDYKGKRKEQLDQTFFNRLIDSAMPKCFMLVMARDITGQQLSDGLSETLIPRLKDHGDLNRLIDMLKTSSFKDNTRVMFSLSSEGKFKVDVAGKELGVIESRDLCKAIVRVYFDEQCIDKTLRENLTGRIPDLIG